MTPEMSVVLPVRDQATRLRLTLAALERQDDVAPEAYEVIVVDDNSSDTLDTVLTAARREAPYALRSVHCDSNGARGIPRNVGVAESRGALVVFLDADALPSRSLLARHRDAHAERSGRLLLGDAYVLPGTEGLLDPADGTSTRPFTVVKDPLVVPLDEVRRGMDALLAQKAEKGIYPRQALWHQQIEEMLLCGSSLSWVGVIPHNLSIARATFDELGGFDPTLLHAEGWDLGLRAARAGKTFGFVRGAQSFHLYHWRAGSAQAENFMQASRALRERYPEARLDLFQLWTGACAGDPFVPSELDLANWRVFERRVTQASDRAEIEALDRAYRRIHEPRPLFESWFDALNAPFSPR